MEVMVASAITIIIMAGFMTMFIHAMKMWQQEEIKNEINFNLEEALEKIRRDLRLSSLTKFQEGQMAFYASTAGTYTAISIPISNDTDGDGLLDTDTNGLIQWNQTVIYHIRPGSPDKLMRTVYAPRYTNATAPQIYSQLASVVNATSDAQVLTYPISGSSETGTTMTVFENLVSLSFDTPLLTAGFDCYAATAGYTNYLWGSLVLSGGLHLVTFTITNRNAASSANNIAIDYVKCSASGSARDGELFVPANSHPTNAFYSYSTVPAALATNVVEVYMGPEWIGQSTLAFNLGSSTGSVTLNITNDLWCDNNFNNPSYLWASNCVSDVNTNFGAADVVFVPVKGVAWSASDSGENVSPDRIPEVTLVTNYLYGISSNSGIGLLKLEGCWARFLFERETNSASCSLLITNARIYNASGTVFSNITFNSGTNFVMMYPEGPQSTNSDWVPMWEIYKGTNYMVRFETGVAGDRDYDLFFGENSPRAIRYYNNTGTVSGPAWTLVNATWLSGFSYCPAPFFADIDGDGDYDCFVGAGGAHLFMNNGTSRSPSMGSDLGNPFPISCGCPAMRIAVVDINGDGKLDAFVSHDNSLAAHIWYVQNNGTPRTASWTSMGTLKDNLGATISVSGDYMSPEFADIDGDGLYDLFSGCGANGNLYLWKNTGTATSPQFTFVTSSYLTNPPAATRSVPRFVDIDADGNLDLFVGCGDGVSSAGDEGNVIYYHNSGSATNAVWDARVTVFSSSLKMSAPAFCNIDTASGAQGNGPRKWQNSEGSILGSSNGVNVSSIYGLSSVEVGYPRFAKFRSGIFDTTKANPVYGQLNWTEGVNAGCDTYVRVRFSDLADMSDLTENDWVGEGGSTNYFQNNTANSIFAGTGYRYVQYDAMLEVGKGGHTEAHTNNSPPMLRDVTIDWSWLSSSDQGSLCDLWTGLGLGPDRGIVSVKIDGRSPVKGIQARMQIYKAGRTGTNYSSGTVEVWPLNTRR